LRQLRRRIGMIFQQFNLAKRLSVIENVLAGGLGYQPSFRSTLRIFSQEERRQALINLKRVGLLQYAYKRADELSGGEQQRVAIARTLMQQPALIFLPMNRFRASTRNCRASCSIFSNGLPRRRHYRAGKLAHARADPRVCGSVIGLKQGRIVSTARHRN